MARRQSTDLYHGRLCIPKGTSGKMRIVHQRQPAGYLAPLNSPRTALLGVQLKGQVGSVLYDRPTCWHELREDGQGTWMTDLPIEQQQHLNCLRPVMNGRVLVGGLGLGLAVQMLSERLPLGRDRDNGIKKIVVVEKSADVIALVEKATRKRTGLGPDVLEIVNQDLFQFLGELRKDREHATPGFAPFDWAFYDIWQGDGEREFAEMVMPLRRLSEGVVENPPICWNEDVMRGQLFHALLTVIYHYYHNLNLHPEQVKVMEQGVPAEHPSAPYVNWRVPFALWVRDSKPDGARAQAAARVYADLYGMPDWERRWQTWIKE